MVSDTSSMIPDNSFLVKKLIFDFFECTEIRVIFKRIKFFRGWHKRDFSPQQTPINMRLKHMVFAIQIVNKSTRLWY